ncbi:MAG: radical SAM protein [Clostridia bacterium]
MYRGKTIQIRKEDEGLYILRIRRSGSYFFINETLKIILIWADEGMSINDIPAKLKSSYGISQKNAELYVAKAVSLFKVDLFGHSLTRELKTPLRVSWKLTSRCNLKCKHCYVSCTTESQDTELSVEQCMNIINKLDAADIFDVSITGGEIFVRDDIKKIIEMLAEKGFDISLFTNGILIDKNYDWLSKINIRRYNISIDGLEKEHDYIRGNGNFVKTWNTIKKLKSDGKNIIVNCVVNSINVNSLVQIHKMFVEEGIDYQFTLHIPLGRGGENIDLLCTSEEYLNSVTKLQNELLEYGEGGVIVSAVGNKIIEVYKNGDVIEKEDNWSCNAGNTKFDINWDGNVLVCPMCESSMLGNILNKSVRELWKNESRKEFVKNKKRAVGHFCVPLREVISEHPIAKERMQEFLGENILVE